MGSDANPHVGEVRIPVATAHFEGDQISLFELHRVGHGVGIVSKR